MGAAVGVDAQVGIERLLGEARRVLTDQGRWHGGDIVNFMAEAPFISRPMQRSAEMSLTTFRGTIDRPNRMVFDDLPRVVVDLHHVDAWLSKEIGWSATVAGLRRKVAALEAEVARLAPMGNAPALGGDRATP